MSVWNKSCLSYYFVLLVNISYTTNVFILLNAFCNSFLYKPNGNKYCLINFDRGYIQGKLLFHQQFLRRCENLLLRHLDCVTSFSVHFFHFNLQSIKIYIQFYQLIHVNQFFVELFDEISEICLLQSMFVYNILVFRQRPSKYMYVAIIYRSSDLHTVY